MVCIISCSEFRNEGWNANLCPIFRTSFASDDNWVDLIPIGSLNWCSGAGVFGFRFLLRFPDFGVFSAGGLDCFSNSDFANFRDSFFCRCFCSCCSFCMVVSRNFGEGVEVGSILCGRFLLGGVLCVSDEIFQCTCFEFVGVDPLSSVALFVLDRSFHYLLVFRLVLRVFYLEPLPYSSL